jgi:hypothetical protein
MDLPRIDSHSVEVDAPAAVAWQALLDWMAASSQDQRLIRFARLLSCEPVQGNGEPGALGSTVPGFRVARSLPPKELALEGGHRFSDYSLRFDIEQRGDRSLCTATTHAAFPGLSGQLYKTAVIRSRAHRLVTRRLLDQVARRAQDAKLNS